MDFPIATPPAPQPTQAAPTQPDIYSYGFDKSLNRPSATTGNTVAYNVIADATNAGTLVSGGSATFTSLAIGGITQTVGPGDDINAAIRAINAAGGGTVQLRAGTYYPTTDINVLSRVSVVGQGKDVTILDFNGNGHSVKSVGTAASPNTNIKLQDFTVQNGSSYLIAQIYLVYTNNFTVNGVRSTAAQAYDNFCFEDCQNFVIINSQSDQSGWAGFEVYRNGLSSGTNLNYTFLNCVCDNNHAAGFYMNNADGGVFNICTATNHSSTSYGGFYGGGKNIFLGCISSNNYNGFVLANNGASLIGCLSTGCNASGSGAFVVPTGGANHRMVGCYAYANNGPDFAVPITASGVTMVGCSFESVGATPNLITTMTDAIWESWCNSQMSTVSKREALIMKNTSGASLSTGQAVIFKSASGGDEVTTTSTNGDNKVFGMALETISNNAYGYILLQGATTKLYVKNGTSSISVGDWLSTYSEAYYAKKAVAGETAFAISLSAPTTTTAQISAILFSPRLI